MILAAITTHKREPQMVERAVKSVVNQTYKDWHLLIVDDSPADYELRGEVKRMAEQWCSRDSRITYMQHDKNYGSQRARNNALKYALENNYEFIAYLDDDDEWLPEKLERQLAKFSECDEDVAMIACGSIYFNEQNVIKSIYKNNRVNDDFVFTTAGRCGPTSSPLVRTKCLEAVGGWDELMPARQDWETWIRICRAYKVDAVEEALLGYHNHGGESIFNGEGSWQRRTTAHERIIEKNMDYLSEHTDYYWLQLRDIFILYVITGKIKKAFSIWLKAVKLKPLRITENLGMFYRALKAYMKIKHPKLFYWLKYKLKGEEN